MRCRRKPTIASSTASPSNPSYTWAKNLADNQGPEATAFAGENGGNVGQVSSYLTTARSILGMSMERGVNAGSTPVFMSSHSGAGASSPQTSTGLRTRS